MFTCGLCTLFIAKVWVISHVLWQLQSCSYRADNCLFWWSQSYNLCSLFLSLKIVTLLIFYYKVSVWYCQSMWREKENIFCREVDVVKNKNLEDITVTGRSQMYCPASKVWGNWWKPTLSAFVFLQNITTQSFPGFSFLCFTSYCFPFIL